MPKTLYKSANKYYRVDRLKQFSEPRRRLTRDYYSYNSEQKRGRIIKIISVIAGVLILQSIFRLPWLTITSQNIVIEGLQQVPKEQVLAETESILNKRRWLIFKNNNYLLFRSYDLQTKLENNLFLTNIIIKKTWPHVLKINVQERISNFIRQTAEGYWQLNYDGQTLGQIQTVLPDSKIIADERADQTTSISLAYMEQATKVLKAWTPNLPGIAKFHLTDEADLINLETVLGYRVLLSTKDDYTAQITRYEAILKQNIMPNNITYVDLRFGENVYFK